VRAAARVVQVVRVAWAVQVAWVAAQGEGHVEAQVATAGARVAAEVAWVGLEAKVGATAATAAAAVAAAVAVATAVAGSEAALAAPKGVEGRVVAAAIVAAAG
jgi:hypothetical protein